MSRALSAHDVLHPLAGTVIDVNEGTAFVFVESSDGARTPLLTMSAGGQIHGSDPDEEGNRLLITGLPGTQINESMLETMDPGTAPALLEKWIFALSHAGRRDRWVERVIAPQGETLRTAPGEFVAPRTDAVPLADESILGWLRVTSGSARWCGMRGADIGVMDSAVPLTRGAWLTSGLRCRIADATAPVTLAEWANAVALVGRLVIAATAEHAEKERDERARRLAEAEQRTVEATRAGVDLLAGVLVGPVERPVPPTSTHSEAVAAALLVARDRGLTVPADARDRAQLDVDLGRDSVVSAATVCNARARTVDLAEGWWQVEAPSLIGRRRGGEYVALLSRGSSWMLVDPKNPDQQVQVTAEVAADLRPRAVELIAVLPRQSQDLPSLLRLATSGSRRDVLVVLVLTAAIGVGAFVTPVVFGQISNSFDTLTIPHLAVLLGVLLLVLAATSLWRYVRSMAMVRIRTRAMAIATGASWDRLMRLRADWHARFSLGDRFTQANSVSMAAMQVPDAVILAMLDSVAVVGSLIAVATTGRALVFALVLVLALQLVIGVALDRAVARRVRARVAASSEANGRLIETLRAVSRLRISGAQGRAFLRWSRAQTPLVEADLALRRITLAQTVVLAAWPLLGIIVVVVFTGLSDSNYGQFITAQTAMGIAIGAMSAAIMSLNAALAGRATLQMLEPVLEAEPEGLGSGVSAGRLNGALEVRDLVFRYSADGPAVLDGISFSVSPGEHVAIVGGSGCGKTTLMRILLGLADPDSGTIMVDGRDLASLDQPSVRRQIGCVLQSSSVMPGVIADNVDMGRGFDRQEIWRALDAASVGDDIRAMAMGLDTPVVDGGGTISGGQRQRMLIARALAGSPRMLILDEATSALDNLTQAAVVDTLDRLRLTRIVVAHRLSTIRGADRIIVLDAGRVVEQGSYDELMAAEGIFHDLARRQIA